MALHRVVTEWVLLSYNAYDHFFRSGYAVKYYPFTSPARKGHSKIRPIRDGIRFLLTITRLGVLFAPMRIFLPPSTILFAVGSSYLVYRLVSVSRFSGFAGMLIISSMFIFMLGLIAEQITLLNRVDRS